MNTTLHVVQTGNILFHYTQSENVVALILDLANYSRYVLGHTEEDTDWQDHTLCMDGIFEASVTLVDDVVPSIKQDCWLLYCVFCDKINRDVPVTDHVQSRKHRQNWKQSRHIIYRELPFYTSDKPEHKDEMIHRFNNEISHFCFMKHKEDITLFSCCRIMDGKLLSYSDRLIQNYNQLADS